MFKKHMAPLTHGGDRTVHQGKGARPFVQGPFSKAPFSPSPPRTQLPPTPGPGSGMQPDVFPSAPMAPKPDVPIG